MKKVFLLLAAASFMFMACEPKNNPDKPDDGKEPEKPAEYVQPINIDGDFSDWAKLDASKVATATCASDAKYTDLKLAKVYADETYIFMYIEFVPQETESVSLDIMLNADGSDSTGGYADLFSDPNSEWLIEGPLADWNAALFKWWGGVGEDGWTWSDPNSEHGDFDAWGAILPEGSGFAASAGDMKAGKMELSILREALTPVEFGDKFSLGFDLSADWAAVGVLPNTSCTDDNPNGKAPKLEVTVVK